MIKSSLPHDFAKKLADLHQFHYQYSKEFKNIVDSMDLYKSRLVELEESEGEFGEHDAVAAYHHYLLGQSIDHVEELTYYGRKRPYVQTSNVRLPLEHASDRHETSAKPVSDDLQTLIF